MARNVLINGSRITDPIAIHVGEPIVLMLLLCLDTEDAIGDKWSATALSGGLTFTPTDVEVPVGAVSPVTNRLESTGGFAQPGDHQVLIFKLVGHGADAAIPAITINFQVTAAPAQPVIAQPQRVARRRSASATPVRPPAGPIQQPVRTQVVAAAAPPGGNCWIKGLSMAAMIMSAIVLISLAALVWMLVDTMRLSNASYTPPPEKSHQSSSP